MCGHRCVPVELGNYLATKSSQKIVSIYDFILQDILSESNAIVSDERKPIAYLAQHKLLQQVPQLRKDILIPDYCTMLLPEDEEEKVSCGGKKRKFEDDKSGGIGEEDCEDDLDYSEDGVHIQAWFGPSTTVSPLHHDPYHNLLAQLSGNK